MEEPTVSQNIEVARQFLESKQASWTAGVAVRSNHMGRQAALDAAQRRMDPSLRDGDFVWEAGFRYRATTEASRWERTRQIIDRVGPGPNEDGVYFELLARQAASVELTLLELAEDETLPPKLPLADALQGILIGTTGEPRSDASTSHLPSSAVVALSAGMVYLMYQAAKAVVLSWKLEPSKGAAIKGSTSLDDVIDILESDSRAVDQLANTLLAWLLTGVARPANSVVPPEKYISPLTLLINNAERFVIAHEYCHALFDSTPYTAPSWLPEPATAYDKEFRADLFATVVLIRAGDSLDRMAPNMVLQGAAHAMKIHEIADRAIDLARGGDGNPVWSSMTHPPFSQRAQAVFSAYEDLVDISDERLELEPAYFVASTLDELWTRTQPKIETQLKSGVQVAPLWTRIEA
jgi:hypothetical protein